MHIIDLDDSILSIITIHPEVKDILFNIGFKDIVKPGMLQTVGRIMTLRKGSIMKSIDLNIIIKAFKDKGYTIKE